MNAVDAAEQFINETRGHGLIVPDPVAAFMRAQAEDIERLRKRSKEIQEEATKKYAPVEAEIAEWQSLMTWAQERYADRSQLPGDSREIAILLWERSLALQRLRLMHQAVREACRGLYRTQYVDFDPKTEGMAIVKHLSAVLEYAMRHYAVPKTDDGIPESLFFEDGKAKWKKGG